MQRLQDVCRNGMRQLKENEKKLRQEIQEERRNEAILKRLASIIESSDDAIFSVNLECIIENWNPGAERLYGFTPEEAIGKSVFMLMPGNDEEEQKKIFDKIRRGEYLTNYRAVRVRKDCEPVTISLTVSPVRDENGTVIGASVIARDMTEMVCMEKKLEESERFAFSAIDSLTAHIAILDEKGMIIAVNKAWRDFAADNPPVETNVCEGANYFAACNVVDAADRVQALAFVNGIRAVMAGERQEFSMEYPCHSPSEQRWFWGKATCFRGVGPLRVVVAHEDITERKLAEERLTHHREHLEEMVKIRTTELEEMNAQLIREVVEKRRAEQAILESEERFRILLDMAPDIICRIKEDRTIDFISTAVRHIGFEPDELIGRPFEDIVHPDDRKMVNNTLLEKRIGFRRAATIEFRMLHHADKGSGGETRFSFVELSVRGIWDVPDGEINHLEKHFLYTLGIVHDVTARKKSEEALRESEKALALLKDVASAANAAATSEDALRVAVEGIARYIDWPVGHVYVTDGRNPDVLIPSDIWRLTDETRYRLFREITQKTVFTSGIGMIGRVLESRKVVWFEDVTASPGFLRKKLADDIQVRGAFGFPIVVDGKVHAVLEFFSPNREKPDPALMMLMDEIGVQLGIVFERKRAEDELKKLYRAVEQSPATVVITDVDGKIQYVNPRFSLLTGYSYEEAIGKNPSIMNSGTQPKKFYEDMWNTIIAGREWYGQFCNKKKNGDIYWEWASISPVRNEHGKVTNFVAVKEDITQLLQYEKELRKAKEDAESANRAKSDFLAGMSHELRTPLNAVIGFSEVLQERYFGPLTEKQEEYVRDILESGRHLLSLINDILDLSKVEAGKMELELSDFSMSDLIHNSLVMIREKAAKHRISIQLDIAPEVEKFEIRADERKIKQVLFNLLSNAIKFTTEGGSIHLLADFVSAPVPARNDAPSVRFLQISVHDDGIGLSAENQIRVFEHFYQVSGDRRDKTPGTGLGLPLSRELIELHGGTIWAESDGEGKGSRFTFRIPVDRAE